MAKFVKKPVVVEAEQWFPGKTVGGVQRFGDSDPRVNRHMLECLPFGADERDYGYIETLEGGHIVSEGDWIITGVKSERYPCKPDVFAATYAAVSQEEPMSDLNEPRSKIAELLHESTKRYRVLEIDTLDTDALERQLNEFGAEGWMPSCPVGRYLILARLSAFAQEMTQELVARTDERTHSWDAPGGRRCQCGKPSRHESAWCGTCWPF